MVDYTEIEAELNTQWNAGVIAEPTFKDGNKSTTSKYPNVVFIYMDTKGAQIPKSAINGSLEKRITSFLITIVASTRVDLEKHIGETRRIINAKTIAGGWWRITSQPYIYNVLKRYKATLMGNETKMIAASGWD